jgi:signal transduction histidine kinase
MTSEASGIFASMVRPTSRAAPYKARSYLSLFGIAITIPLLLLAGALLLQSASVQQAQLQTQILQVLDSLVNEIDRDLDSDITILRTLATSQALASADWRTFYDEAKAGLQGRAYLVLVDSGGRQLINTYVPYGEQPAMTGDPETVRRIVQTKAPVVSNLFVSLVVKRPVFNVSIPILENGQVRYVMSLGLFPDDVLALLNSQKLSPEWVTLVWDANGILLARSRDNARYVGKPVPPNMREQAAPGVVRTVNLDGADVLHATAHSRMGGWGVGVNIPYGVVTQQMRSSLMWWGGAAILAIAIALFSGAFFARQITQSLALATKAAAAFGRGEQFPLAGSRLKEADTFLIALNNAQKTRENTEDKLRVSNAALLRANEDLRQFAFAASHDLQEPLRMTTTYSQLLIDSYKGSLAGDAELFVRYITEGTKRMRVLLSDLLAYAQIGETHEASRPISLDAARQKALENCRAAIDESKAAVESDELPVANGYEPHFVQLFQNLIGNAIKYRSEKPPRIIISVRQDGEQWLFVVRDNGIGIDPEYHKQVFGVFKRLHGKEIPGTGIGLAICKRVVERYGGNIWVESRIGEGSAFYFTLPVSRGAG